MKVRDELRAYKRSICGPFRPVTRCINEGSFSLIFKMQHTYLYLLPYRRSYVYTIQRRSTLDISAISSTKLQLTTAVSRFRPSVHRRPPKDAHPTKRSVPNLYSRPRHFSAITYIIHTAHLTYNARPARLRSLYSNRRALSAGQRIVAAVDMTRPINE